MRRDRNWRRHDPPAIERARRVWQECALYVRADLRAAGVKGPLRRLDDAVIGMRGRNVPAQLAAFAEEMRAGGVPEALAAERLAVAAREITSAIYAAKGA